MKQKNLAYYLGLYTAAATKEAIKLVGSFYLVKAIVTYPLIMNLAYSNYFSLLATPMATFALSYAALSTIKNLRQKPEFNLNYQITRSYRRRNGKNPYSNYIRKLLIEDYGLQKEMKVKNGKFNILGIDLSKSQVDNFLDKKKILISDKGKDLFLKYDEEKGIERTRVEPVHLVEFLNKNGLKENKYVEEIKLGKDIQKVLLDGKDIIISNYKSTVFPHAHADIKISNNSGKFVIVLPTNKDYLNGILVKKVEEERRKTWLNLIFSNRKNISFKILNSPEILGGGYRSPGNTINIKTAISEIEKRPQRQVLITKTKHKGISL